MSQFHSSSYSNLYQNSQPTHFIFPTLNKLSQSPGPTLPHCLNSDDDDDSDDTESDEENENETTFPSTDITKLSLDLMVNHKYLAKNNPIIVNKRQELHAQLIKHKREIMKIIQNCFHELELGNEETLGKEFLMEQFESFAKVVLKEIQLSKMPEVDEMFSLKETIE